MILLVNLCYILLTQRLEFEWLLREHVPKVLAQLGSILQVLLFLLSYCNIGLYSLKALPTIILLYSGKRERERNTGTVFNFVV